MEAAQLDQEVWEGDEEEGEDGDRLPLLSIDRGSLVESSYHQLLPVRPAYLTRCAQRLAGMVGRSASHVLHTCASAAGYHP